MSQDTLVKNTIPSAGECNDEYKEAVSITENYLNSDETLKKKSNLIEDAMCISTMGKQFIEKTNDYLTTAYNTRTAYENADPDTSLCYYHLNGKEYGIRVNNIIFLIDFANKFENL